MLCLVFAGTLAAFRRVYEDPILLSRQSTASSEERFLGQSRARELNRITSLFILRRTQDVNNRYLPPRGLSRRVISVPLELRCNKSTFVCISYEVCGVTA